MDTSYDQSQHLQHAQIQKIAPHLIQASEILQCTAIELQQAIELELMENPALESLDAIGTDHCPECGYAGLPCPHCNVGDRRALLDGSTNSASSSASESAERSSSTSGESDDANSRAASESPESEREPVDYEPEYDASMMLSLHDVHDQHVKEEAMESAFDPLSLAPAAPNLIEHLMSRLRGQASSEQQQRTYEYLVNHLDERGWLKIEPFEAMAELRITEELLNDAITALQSCDPTGIGARDLQECLLLQLAQLEDEGLGNALAQKIVRDQWEALAQRRFDQIARRTSSAPTAVMDAVHFIQSELAPSPATNYRETWQFKPDSSSEAVKPDVFIRRSATGFDIEVSGYDTTSLHINSRYRSMYESLRQPRAGGGNGVSSSTGAYVGSTMASGSGNGAVAVRAEMRGASQKSDGAQQERKHIAQYVDRANLFLKNIQQRKKTIERITRCLIEIQQGFIETGSRAFLVPLTRTELAERAGLHESTVSRALLRKFVQLPSQDVVAFDSFFTAAGSVKDMIASLIAGEDCSSPLSDETLRHKLEEAGHSVARRTIVKYREGMRIPASYMRRTH